MKTTYVLIQENHFEMIMEKLEKLENVLLKNHKPTIEDPVEWITNKKFMESVSIRAYNTFYKIRDKMPDALKREINGKQYIHKDAVNEYFKGSFSN